MKILILGLFLLTLKTTVYGYIDPGTGTYLLQLLGTAILGGLYTIKIYWRQIRAFFVKKNP
jgi:hypothetical protein